MSRASFAAGGLDRAIRLQRLPDVMTQSAMTLRRRIKVRPDGDTRLFIRVQQEDGHRLWTSPIYLFADEPCGVRAAPTVSLD